MNSLPTSKIMVQDAAMNASAAVAKILPYIYMRR